MVTCPRCFRGTCQVTHDVAKCVCEAGWFLSDCRKHNCNGNGYSEIVNEQAVCNCHKGWYGDFCQLNKCKNGQYYNGHCYCHANYYGKWCTEYRPLRTCSRNCGNGNCYMGETSDGDYCVCNSGFSGSNCNTIVCTGRCPGQECRIINNKAECYDYTPTSCFQKSCSNNQHCVMVGFTPTCQREPAEDDSILQVESETKAEADVEVQTDDQVKIGGYLIGEIQDRPIPVCDPGFSGPNCNTVVCTDRCFDKSCRIINNYAYCYTDIQKPIFEKKFLEARRMKSHAKTPVLSILFPAILVILK